MSQESANWCRFAQLMINKGANVLRTFFQLEILTSIIRDYYDIWMRSMDTANVDCIVILLNNFDYKLENSVQRTLYDLRQSWIKRRPKTPTINKQIDVLKEWKKDIEQEQNNPVSEGVKKRLDEWLIKIEQEIQKMSRWYTLICELNDTFNHHLYNSQRDLFLEVEANDKLLNQCGRELISEYKLSHTTLPQGVKDLKFHLQFWKSNCYNVLRAFKAECDNLIISGQQKAQGDTIMVDCIKKFQTEITAIELDSEIDTWCDSWYTELEDAIHTCEKGDYAQAMSVLSKIASFRDIKVRKFLSQLKPPSTPSNSQLRDQLFSKLKDFSRAKDLEQLDLTLLVQALKEINIVKSKNEHREKDLPDSDTSTGADILRLKSYRNDIVAHIAEAQHSSSDFEKFWGEVKILLCKIASRCGDKFKTRISLEIDTTKALPLEPRMVQQLRTEYTKWCKQDIQVEFPSGLQQMWDSIDIAGQNMRRARTCSKCMQTFPKESELDEHKKIHEVYPCPRCNTRCSTEGELQEHMKAHQARTCSKCMKTLPTESELDEHMKIHEVHPCPRCDMQCSTEGELQEHMKTHQGGAGVAAAAGAGAAVGLALGPPGAVIGAAVGGLLGYLSSQRRQ